MKACSTALLWTLLLMPAAVSPADPGSRAANAMPHPPDQLMALYPCEVVPVESGSGASAYLGVPFSDQPNACCVQGVVYHAFVDLKDGQTGVSKTVERTFTSRDLHHAVLAIALPPQPEGRQQASSFGSRTLAGAWGLGGEEEHSHNCSCCRATLTFAVCAHQGSIW